MEQANQSAQNQEQAPHFEIQRIYVKGISYETPNTPQTFTEAWNPEVTLNLETKSNRVQDQLHEVVLSITATVTSNKKTAFLIEVQQAGIFLLSSFPADHMHQMLGSFCPNILFPYAREVISDMVVRGGFPQLLLAPVNFDALYADHQQKQSGSQAANVEGNDTIN